MNTMLVFAATDLEFRLLASTLSNSKPISSSLPARVGHIGRTEVRLYLTRMGPRNAAKHSAAVLRRDDARDVLVCGFGGALSPELNIGDAVICRDCVSDANPDGTRLKCNAPFSDRLKTALEGASLKVFEGRAVMSAGFVCRTEDKLSLGTRFAARIVDMESFQILTNVHEFGRRGAVLRVVSDDARHDAPDFSRALKADAEVDFLGMGLCLARNPVRSYRFLRDLRTASRELKQAFRVALTAEF